MDTEPDTALNLDDIRREIDTIDAQMLELLQKRFEASQSVRKAKDARGETGGTPVRPAREAALMRKLIAARREPLPLDFLVYLWRSILASSTLLQADASVNVSRDVFDNPDLRDTLRCHFGRIPVVAHDNDGAALDVAEKDSAAMALLPLHGDWPRSLAGRLDSGLAITGAVPFVTGKDAPELIVISHAPIEPTGQDETVVVSAGQLPRDFAPAPLWRCKLDGGEWLTSLPGYLLATEMPLVSLTHSNDDLALCVLGRYPSPLTID